MKDRLKEVFGMIRAEEDLKESTRAFIIKRTKGYTRGNRIKRRFYVYGAVLAGLVLLIIGGYRFYFTPAFKISIDINPSLELSVNKLERVISVSGFNEDGQELAGTLNVNFKHYSEAVDIIIQNEKIAALLSDNEIMSITVTGSDKGQSDEILSRLEECTSHQSGIHYCYFSSERAEGAHQAGLSCGRYRLFLILRELGSDITPEEIGSMSMKEIETLIDSLAEDNAGTSGYGSEHGHHHYHH